MEREDGREEKLRSEALRHKTQVWLIGFLDLRNFANLFFRQIFEFLCSVIHIVYL